MNAILSRDSNYGKGKPGTRDNAKGGKGNKSKGKGSKNDAKRCMHCNNKGHTIDECRKKANGEPSRKEILELAKKVAKDGKPDSGRPNASINTTRAVIETPQSFFASINAVNDVSNETMRFLLDTGANHHLTGDREILASKLTLLRNPLRLGLAGTKHTVLAHHIGSINFALDDGANIHIKDVHYVPDSRINILSVDLLMSAGWSVDSFSSQAHRYQASHHSGASRQSGNPSRVHRIVSKPCGRLHQASTRSQAPPGSALAQFTGP